MSKVPIIKGPVNLPGPLSGNFISFIGPEVAFLEAPVNFELSRYLPGARKNSGPLLDSCAVTLRSSAGEGERVGTLFHSNHSLCETGLFFCVSIRRTMQ